jgi:DNA-damage-inducible protein D
MNTEHTMEQLEAAKRTTPKGGEYWMARDIQQILGYSKWENFYAVIERASESCRKGQQDVADHFLGIRKMIEVGKGAKVPTDDFCLTRYACYLVAMNGESSKPEIASAQRYFAVQTRLQEIDRAELHAQDRLRLRDKLKESTKQLASAAKRAGVQEYALFHHAGYIGLYKMGLREIKRKKGIAEDENLYDRAGRLELSANDFKATLTEESLKKKNIKGQRAAEAEHERIGGVVRSTMQKEAGVYPEDLPAEPSIKKLVSKKTASKQLPPN